MGSLEVAPYPALAIEWNMTCHVFTRTSETSVLARYMPSMRPAIMSTALYAQPAPINVLERGRRSGRAWWRIR